MRRIKPPIYVLTDPERDYCLKNIDDVVCDSNRNVATMQTRVAVATVRFRVNHNQDHHTTTGVGPRDWQRYHENKTELSFAIVTPAFTYQYQNCHVVQVCWQLDPDCLYSSTWVTLKSPREVFVNSAPTPGTTNVEGL